jgi:GR25 family glycosyltransferase involved in LPS biosynthesis
MEYISKAFYINLQRRTDRRTEIEGELSRLGLSAERFDAIEEAPGYVGCFKSHLEVLKKARDAGYPNVLVLEDDFECIVSKEEFDAQLRAFFTSNIPYNVLMLSYNLHESEPHNEIVGYARNAATASGYVVHRDYYDTLIGLYEWALPQLIETGAHWIYMNDVIWGRLQAYDEWFYFLVRLGRQRKSYSDLQERVVEYNV